MAYAIGVARPVSIMVETFGTETVDIDALTDAVKEVFDLRPAAIIRDLDLRRPIYKKTAAMGTSGARRRNSPGDHRPRRRPEVRPRPLIITVVPDVAGLDGKEFDYLVRITSGTRCASEASCASRCRGGVCARG